MFGDGLQTRSFCYVDDLVSAMVMMMETEDDVRGPLNIGNPTEFTMIELAEMVLKKTGSKSKLKHLPLPTDDPKQRKPDISLAQKSLGWTPKTSLDEGLDRTIAYFRQTLG